MSTPNIRAEQLKKIQEMQRKIVEKMGKIKYKIAILSGKGGVGKSFVTASLAIALASRGKRVAVLDADIHGPSIPKLLGVHGYTMMAGPEGILPVTAAYGVKVVSMDFLLPSEETPLIWRGPLKTNAIRELLAEVAWGELDYLLIDLPPGTGDEALSIAQMIPKVDGAIIVTIPSDLSRIVVKKAVMFAKKLAIPVIGIVENMSGFTCPESGKTYYIFGKGAGKRIAEEMNVDFLGEIPLDPRISEANDKGVPFFVEYPDTEAAKAFLRIADKIIAKVEGG
jgi:ATP-binding protein involved in chromosome partitioning